MCCSGSALDLGRAAAELQLGAWRAAGIVGVVLALALSILVIACVAGLCLSERRRMAAARHEPC